MTTDILKSYTISLSKLFYEKYDLERKCNLIVISEAPPHKNKQQATQLILKCVEKYICSSLNKLLSSSFQEVKKFEMEENITQVLSILMFPLQDKVQDFWLLKLRNLCDT